MDATLQQRLVAALQPLVSRVRTDITARKGSRGSYWTDEPLTAEALAHHVNGGPARGVCPMLPGTSTTMVGLLDFDSHKGETPWADMVTTVARVADALETMGLQPTAFRSSGGNGIHLVLLWDEPQDAYSVRECLAQVLQACGLRSGTKGVARGEVEVFPRQDEVGPGEHGNQFILPLGGKSELLEPLLDWAPVGKEALVGLQWPTSEPVPVLPRPERAVVLSEDTDPIERVRNALFSIPNEQPDYDHWFNLMCAVHEATGGSEDGCDLYVEWSAQIAEHDEKELRKKWDSIDAPGNKRNAITRASLYHQAGLHGWTGVVTPDAEGFEDVPEADIAAARDMVVANAMEKQREKHEAKSQWRRAVLEAVDEIALQEVVCPAIARAALLEPIDREMLATVIQQRFASFGTKVGIAACRKLVAPPKRQERASGAPEWTDGWVYITAEDKFYRVDSEEFVTAQGFNAKFNRMLPPTPEGELPKTAHRVALDEVGIPTVTRGMYLPWAQPLFTMDGVECVNLYRPSSTPVTAERYTVEGRAAIALVDRHLSLLTGARESVLAVLKSWMAYNVQNPGKKIRWAPLIKGIEGDGKTLIGRVMAAVMGTPNVKDISPKVLNTDFTGWAHKACVGVLEEIRLTGHSRYDVLNALKPNITNNSVAIHAKGQDEFNAINTMNYIAFTNHADALPLSNNDRRFLVIFTPFEDVGGLQKAVGDTGAYFNKLFDAIENHRGELRKWLLEMPIADSFEPDGRAPDTDEKAQMIGMNVGGEEDALNSALENGGVGIGKNVVVVSYLRDAARNLDSEVTLNSSDMSRLLQKMGWTRLPRQLKWKGAPRRVWFRGMGMNPENWVLHQALEATCVDAAGNRLDEDLF